MGNDNKKAPDFKGDGVSLWMNRDKNGDPYINAVVLGGKAISCFKFTPKPKSKPKESTDNDFWNGQFAVI